MKKKFKLTDLDCANCAAKMEDAIRKIKRFMEDEENLSKSAQKIVKTKQQAAGEGAML